jgi:hypothetical protein
MILAAAIIASVVIALLRGGRLNALTETRLRYGGLAVAAFAVQMLFIYQAPSQRVPGVWDWHELLFVGSWLLLVVVVWTNRHLGGIKLVGLGLLLNLIVMVSNGGWMPVTPEAVVKVGYTSLAPSLASGMRLHSSKNIILLREETKLWLLSDVVAVPRPFPVPSVFSIGDVFVALGTFVFIQGGMLGHQRGRKNSIWRSE